MKRFFFLSAFFHGALLLLLFSWEIPLANKLLPRGVLEISLIEKIEEVKPKKVLPSIPKQRVKAKKPGKNEALLQLPEKKEEKQDPTPAVLQEEKLKEMEELPPENKFLPTSAEQPLPVQANVMPPTQGNGNAEVLKVSTGGEGNSMAPGASGETSGSTFLMFTGSRLEKGGTEEKGTKGTNFGKMGEGSHLTVSKMHSSSIEVDRILKQIIRKIEAAKRYPKVARKMGIEGKAVVRFKLKPQGQVEAVEIVESSGSEILDQASLQTVRDAAPLPYKEGWLKVGIVFKIL
jgi:protein TonB